MGLAEHAAIHHQHAIEYANLLGAKDAQCFTDGNLGVASAAQGDLQTSRICLQYHLSAAQRLCVCVVRCSSALPHEAILDVGCLWLCWVGVCPHIVPAMLRSWTSGRPLCSCIVCEGFHRLADGVTSLLVAVSFRFEAAAFP